MKKIAIMYGGPSEEHEVSVRSAKNILQYFEKGRYEVIEIYLHKNMDFENVLTGETFTEGEIFNYLKERNIDFVFPIFHGEYGEDGKIQKKLEENNFIFFGSGSKTSENAMDKNLANKIFEHNNLLVPKTKVIDKDNCAHGLTYPIMIKPVSGGSSVGLFKFENEVEFLNSIDIIFLENREIMIQEFISGREFTCGVIEEIKEGVRSYVALPVTEIVLQGASIFDYNTKYTKNACDEITPADVSRDIMLDLQNVAITCHKVLSCKDISRTDIILSKEGKMYILETNTIPGMTETSFIPAQLKAQKISMETFLNKIIENNVNK